MHKPDSIELQCLIKTERIASALYLFSFIVYMPEFNHFDIVSYYIHPCIYRSTEWREVL